MLKYFDTNNQTYVLGISLVVEALKYKPKEIKEIYLSSNVTHNFEYESLITLCEKNNIIYKVDDKAISALSSKENCYGIAIINRFSTKLSTSKHIILNNLNDEGELGTIIRTMASFGYKDLVLINSNIDVFDPKVIRSTMGGFFHINITKYKNLDEYLNDFDHRIVKIGLKGEKELKEYTYKKGTSIMIDIDDCDYYVKHREDSDINLSSLSTIIMNYLK